ncbi:ATP-grasp domain-containing protein [Capnocytophaga catalasegens]|uniref:D-alanine--D-alanine ligase n=1 Tax=Capnocytophaga catalasegens TaxID=1004260 RepID=A0AAV5ARE2_9FLAO|nr:ATP-grasp domain-containing protein [Capnocytophaga catalasegens]GIZ15513.1 D-alanine--D-alanine ligase [Capnocytophaga catalasegens]GJM49856.1 D-alanine--D-alanine ligase [Capnocytophaga catalasegens]GJM54028.1 D-alanine--D-alanine ligase [Capnocytophaga catalasegens]
MKTWIVTTKQEEFRLFNKTHHNDLKSVIDFDVIFVDKLECLKKIQKGDTAFIRTKNNVIIDYLYTLDINIIGEKSETIKYDDNKEALKEILRRYNILVPQSFTYTQVKDNGITYFVKPLSLGDSIGVDKNSICKNKTEVFSKLIELKEKYHSCCNLIEEYIDGEDVSIAVIKNHEKVYAYGMKINADTNILDFQTKLGRNAIYTPFNESKTIQTAIKVFDVIKANSYARIDFRIDAKGNAYVLEINLCAGLGKKDGYLYKCFELNSNISYKEMIHLILKTNRQNKQNKQ